MATIVDKELTWLLYDCGLFIRECHSRDLIDIQLLCDNFMIWIRRVIGESHSNLGREMGYVEHSMLFGKRSVLVNYEARKLQSILLTWMWQSNLGFARIGNSTDNELDLEAHVDGMLRFASCMESSSSRPTSNGFKNDSLVSDFEELTV